MKRVRDGKNCTTKVEVCVCMCAQLYPTLYDPVDCSLPGSSVHGIFQSGILERVPISYSWGFSLSVDQTHVSFISAFAGKFFTTSTALEAQSRFKDKLIKCSL